MVRYLFPAAVDSRLYRDEVGRRFGTIEDAKEHALVIARELATDAVCVIDDHGNEVARVPVARGAPDSPLDVGRDAGGRRRPRAETSATRKCALDDTPR
jgi:hypothetical protein